VAFKHTERLISREIELDPLIAAGTLLVARGSAGAPPIGCLFYNSVTDAEGKLHVHFGPFAVSLAQKGTGVGRQLLAELDRRARALGAASLDIEVVNTRDDLFPMYARLGYVKIGEAPFPAPERTTRPVHFILMRRPL
jgi:predicted N-acetyltransferase YhbS